MRSENSEQNTNSLSDELPVCKSTGTGSIANQSYKDDGQQQSRQSYDHSFQCQQIEDRTCLYAICSGHKLAAFAKEKLVAEILFGQLNGSTTESVKDVLRLAFTAFEKDYVNLIDESLTQEVQRRYQLQANGYEATQEYEEAIKQNDEISITLALIYNAKLYICNVGRCRAILCKTDDRNVLRAVQLSGTYENGNETVCPCEKTESITSRLEIVGPIPLDDSCRFIVLMSCGLCKTLHDLYKNDEHITNREIIQAIVQQFRIQTTLTSVAQSVINKVATQHYDMNLTNGMLTHRSDITLMVRNFNFPMPNLIQQPRYRANVTFNPINREHLLTNSTFSSSNQNTLETVNSYESSTTTSSSDRTEMYDKNLQISPYVDFSDYYRRVEEARNNGTLSTKIQFD